MFTTRSSLLAHASFLAAATALFFLLVPQPPSVQAFVLPPESYGAAASLARRQLRAETLDGSIVEPIVVDFLDQLQYYQNELANGAAVEGSEQYRRIQDETNTVGAILSNLIEDYATIVSGPPPEETAGPLTTLPLPEPTPTGAGGRNRQPGNDDDGSPRPSRTTSSSISTIPGTIVPQPNTSIIVIASQGTTRTITGIPLPAAPTGTAGRGGPRGDERAATTIVAVRAGVTQTFAVGLSEGALETLGPNSRASVSARWNMGLVFAGMVGVLMNVL